MIVFTIFVIFFKDAVNGVSSLCEVRRHLAPRL